MANNLHNRRVIREEFCNFVAKKRHNLLRTIWQRRTLLKKVNLRLSQNVITSME